MICPRCEKEMGDDFRPKFKICRLCCNASARLTRLKAQKKTKADHIVCNVCKERKTEFRVGRLKCVDCERTDGRSYRKKNPEKAQKWVEENREKMSELQHDAYERNKKTIRVKYCERLKTDANFKLVTNHRAITRKMITHVVTKTKYMDCDQTRFTNWLSFQFEGDMRLDNKTWASDHVIPCDYFLNKGYDKDVVLTWFNISPVTESYNLKKNKHIDKKQCIKHLDTVKSYCKLRKIKEPEKYIEALTALCETP